MFRVLVILLFGLNAWAETDSLIPNLHLQATTVTQDHGPFASPYQGTNSLNSGFETQTSATMTIFAGFNLWSNAALYINPELSGGSGLSHTLGVAGFPNGEIYRVDDPKPKWNLARFYLHQVFNLSGEMIQVKDDKNQVATSVATENIALTVGRFALNDFFDNNTYSHDPRTQFLNWALMDNAAWDYAADTRGYSWGFVLEYNQPRWSLRWATVQVPLQANQLEMDKNFPARRGDNLEYERRYEWAGQPGVTRVLFYANHADMGNYRRALTATPVNPDVTQTRTSSVKYGLGVNVEQALNENLGLFARASFDDGHTETWAFTEVDRAFSVGGSLRGTWWRRAADHVGLAALLNGLSPDHRDYLAAGGYGFIVGDGKLNYQLEQIAELYYSLHIMTGLDLTGDLQYIRNPGYNADRGPALASAVRMHFEY